MNMLKKLILFLMIAVLLFGYSCGKKPTAPVTKKTTFTVYGAVVKDMNFSKDIVYFTVRRNDTLYNSATVKVGNKTILNSGAGLYDSLFADTTFKVKTAYTDSIISSQDTVTITFGFTMPDTFSAQTSSDKDTFRLQDFPIEVTWTASSNSSGYFISMVKGDTIPGAMLYSTTKSGTSASIPGDAVLNVFDQLVTGYYWIFVVAYNKSFVSYPDVPFDLPVGLPANNISGAEGTIGAGVIAKKVTIYVAPSP
jgi:hypothetical protein